MERIVDSHSNPIYSWTTTTVVGSINAGTTFIQPFDLRGCPNKIFTLKNNGTTALVNGSVLVSHDGNIWSVVDGTSFNTLAAAAVISSKINDPRAFYQFSGSVATTNVITMQVSASSF